MVKSKTERDKYIECNLGLVHSICRRFIGRGIEYDDLYQAGCIGLVKAFDAFDDERGLCFSTYAVPVIMGEVRRLFRDGGSVKVSRSVKELSLKVNRVREKMDQDLGREPTVKELAARMGTSVEQISEAVCASQPTLSLTFKDDENEIAEIDLPVSSDENNISDKILLDEAFKNLNDIERQIIKYRYYDSLTQSATAQKLKMTQVQISRSEKRILLKLRNILQ